MATLEEISRALKNAHAAGDTAAAQKLAQAYQAEQARSAPAPSAAGGQRGGMVTEGTISRDDYLAQRGGVGFGGRAVPQDIGTAPDGPAMTYNDEGLLGKKPVVSSDAIKDRMFGLDLGTTSRALDTPQRMNVDKMSMAQSAALGVNDLNPIRLATGDRGYEAAMTESLADNPMSTRGGQSLALLSGGGGQLYTAGMKVAPKLVAPAVAARLAGDQLWKQGIRYAGRGVAMTGLGAADYYGYNALAEAPNIARETGAPGPSMGQRIDYANSQIFTPGGAVAALAPFASSLIARPTRYALASGKNVLQAAGNKVLPQAVPAPRQGITQTSKMTPADVQRRVAGFSADLSTMTKTDAERAIDMLLKRNFDPDEAEKMVRFLDYAGKSEVPETLFQLMPNLRRVDQLTVALGTVGGDAKEALAKVLGEQAQESPIVLRNALRKAMGISGKDFYDMQKGIQADQLSAPKEGYKAAYAKEVSDETWEAQILPQLRTKYGREAVADAADYAEGIAGTDTAQLGVARQLAELRDALGSQGATPGKVSTQSLDYIDRMLGDVAEGLKAGTGRRELAKGPKGTQRGIRGNADSGLDAETGLDAPRRLSWELQSAEEAMVFGRKAYKDGTDIETLMDEFAYELSKAGRDGGESETVRGALLMGWLRGAEDDISKATNPQSVIRRMYGSERQREKLLAMMPELADDAGSGFKGSNTKDVRALVGGKREDGREMAGMIDRLKRVSGDYNRIIGNSQSAQRASAVLEESGVGDRINQVFDAILAPKNAAVKAVKAGINVATRPGIYDPGINRELGRLLTARGKKQLLATIAEIRARQIATGKGPKPPGGSPALPPPAGPIRAGGFPGFGGKKPRLEDTKTIPEAAAVLAERFKPRKATRAATEQDWEQASKEAFDLLREQARKQDGFEPGARVWQEKAPDSLTDPKAPPRFVFEDLAQSILRSRGIDPDPVYGRMLAERPTNAETDVFRKTAGHYAGKARAKEREGMALDEMDDTDAAIEQMSSIKPPSRLNGIGAGLRTDLGSGVGGAVFAGAMPMDADATLQDRLNRAGTGFALGYGASKGGRIAARMRDGNAFAGKTATAGVPKTAKQAAKFETPGSPEWEAAKAKGLDMSQAGRMARAKEMGFDTETVLYHGTTKDFDSFNNDAVSRSGKAHPTSVLGHFFAETPEQTIPFAGGRERTVLEDVWMDYPYVNEPKMVKQFARRTDYAEGGKVLPVYVKLTNPKQFSASEWAKLVEEGTLGNQAEQVAKMQALRKSLEGQGFDGIAIEAQPLYGGEMAAKQYVVFDPSNIRSVNAAFDPDKAASPILTAGFGGGRGDLQNAFAGKTATAGVPKTPSAKLPAHGYDEIGARTADAAAIAALGISPTAEAQTGDGSAEVQAANERVNELATFEANAQQKIGNAEQELKAFQAMSVAEKQRFLRDNGFTGPNGEILKDDGATGGLTTYAINRYTDKVRGAISEGTRELSTVRGKMDKAQQAALKAERQAKLKAMQAKNQPNMALDMVSKAAMLAGLAGGVYWAKRGRSGAVAKSAPAAKAAAAKANALLNSKRMTSAKTGPDSLNQRAANINAFWKQGGAGDKVPFKVDGQGNWTDRPGAMEPAQLFSPKWHQQYRNDDVLYMVTAAVDVGGSRAGINYLNDEIKKVDAEYKAYEAEDDFASMERKLAEKTRLEGLRTALQITEKVGGGYLLGRAVGSPLMPYAKVNANVKAAEAQRASLLQKMNPPQKPRPASNNQGQGNP